MDAQANGRKAPSKKDKELQLDVERAVAEGMDTPPAKTGGRRDLRARAKRLWSEWTELLKERPVPVLGVVAGVSFLAGLLLGSKVGRASRIIR